MELKDLVGSTVEDAFLDSNVLVLYLQTGKDEKIFELEATPKCNCIPSEDQDDQENFLEIDIQERPDVHFYRS